MIFASSQTITSQNALPYNAHTDNTSNDVYTVVPAATLRYTPTQLPLSKHIVILTQKPGSKDSQLYIQNQSGAEMSKEEWTPMLTAMMHSDKLEINNQRCIYENDEILVTHSMMNFPDGTSEAVMVVNQLKDGKVIRVETGATPIDSA